MQPGCSHAQHMPHVCRIESSVCAVCFTAHHQHLLAHSRPQIWVASGPLSQSLLCGCTSSLTHWPNIEPQNDTFASQGPQRKHMHLACRPRPTNHAATRAIVRLNLSIYIHMFWSFDVSSICKTTSTTTPLQSTHLG